MRRFTLAAAALFAFIPAVHAQQTTLGAIEAGRNTVRHEQALLAQERAREDAVASLAEDIAKHSQSLEQNPSARRVFMLCMQEDPECIPLIQKANDDFLAHPHMIYGNVYYQCAVTRTNQNNLNRTYQLFIRLMQMDPSLAEWQPWQVVYLTYSNFGGPCSP